MTTKANLQKVIRSQVFQKTLSFLPLPILDVVLRTFAAVKKRHSKDEVLNDVVSDDSDSGSTEGDGNRAHHQTETTKEKHDVLKRRRSSQKNRVRVKQLDPTDPYSPWFRIERTPSNHLEDCESIDEMMWRVLSKYGSRKALGFRRITSKKLINLPNKNFRIEKTFANEYHWMTMFEAQARVLNFLKGLIEMGVSPGGRVVIFVDSRIERVMAIYALLKLGAVACLIYPDRRRTALIMAINESEATLVITSNDWLLRVKDFAPELTKVEKIIVIQDRVNGDPEELYTTSVSSTGERPDLEIITVASVESLGKRSKEDVETLFDSEFLPDPDDPAFLVYTSGSTGDPKAVVWSYKSIIEGTKNISLLMRDIKLTEESTCMLTPVPVLMEVMYTSIMLGIGVAVAYSTKETLMPRNPKEVLSSSYMFDMELLHPEILLAVPQTLNNLRKVFEDSPLVRLRTFLRCNSNMNRSKLGPKSSWPSTEDQVTLKYRLFGGKLKVVLTGAAPLSSKTSMFLKHKLQTQYILHHYGCAEGCSGLCVSVNNESIGNCGFPLWGVQIRLLDWPEGGYFVTDKPNPRGEIVIGSHAMSDGYFKNDELNAKVFFREDGIRWCVTGMFLFEKKLHHFHENNKFYR
jgi:long-chain acyl-CoA synthetase